MGLGDGKAGFLEAGQLLLERLFPGTLVVGEESMPCAKSAEVYDDAAERGGFEEDFSISVRVRRSLLPDRPEKDSLVSLDGRQMRVGEVDYESLDVAWWIQLVEV